MEIVRFGDGTELSLSGELNVERPVNTYTSSTQTNPSIATFGAGNYVITWQDDSGHDGGYQNDIRGQLFNTIGDSVGEEFRVNTYFSTHQYQRSQESVGSLKDGGFVVTWMDQSGHDGGSGWDIRAQRYDASGSAVGTEFMVNTWTSSSQYQPSVAGLEGGGFVITWEDHGGSSHNGGQNSDIYGQLYDAAGARVGGEFRVNATQ